MLSDKDKTDKAKTDKTPIKTDKISIKPDKNPSKSDKTPLKTDHTVSTIKEKPPIKTEPVLKKTELEKVPKKTFLDLKPVKVSPLIKFSRYVLLISGIFYGISKQKVYSSLEKRHRDKQEELKQIKYDHMEKEKRDKPK